MSASSTAETLLEFWLGLFHELIHGGLALGASDPTDVLAGGFTGKEKVQKKTKRHCFPPRGKLHPCPLDQGVADKLGFQVIFDVSVVSGSAELAVRGQDMESADELLGGFSPLLSSTVEVEPCFEN
ncbi:MAG: hypothetical protein GY696_31965 [Gammaproteobacteria bacterium]|nr:hypothetical protein [Gammaproteobacteria bacterium]